MGAGVATIERPAFEPDSGRWIRLGALQALLGISEERHFKKWRDRLGKRWEHVEKKGPHRGTWIYAPGWLAARIEFERGQHADGSHHEVMSNRQRAEMIKLRNLELDLEERELAHAQRRNEVLRMSEVNEILVSVLGGIGRVADKLSPEHKRMLVDEMNEAREVYRSRFNGHSDIRITDAGGAGGIRTGVVDRSAADAADTSRVRSPVRRNAPRRSKGKPKVS